MEDIKFDYFQFAFDYFSMTCQDIYEFALTMAKTGREAILKLTFWQKAHGDGSSHSKGPHTLCCQCYILISHLVNPQSDSCNIYSGLSLQLLALSWYNS